MASMTLEDGGIEGHLDVLEHQHRNGHHQPVHRQEHGAGGDVGQGLFQQQGRQVRAAGADAPEKQQPDAEAADGAAGHGGQEGVVGVARQQRAEEIDEAGEQHRGEQGHHKGPKAHLLPAGQEQRHVQKQGPGANADVGREMGQGGGKARDAAGGNVVGHGEHRNGQAHQHRAQQDKDQVQQKALPALGS